MRKEIGRLQTLNSISMVSTTPENSTNTPTGILWGYLIIEGLKSYLDEILALMDTKGINFLILSETWLRPQQTPSNPAIVWDIKALRPNGPCGRGIGGIIVILNTKLTTV